MTELTIESNLKSLAEKIKSSRQLIRSEEHTKMAYIVPFIALLCKEASIVMFTWKYSFKYFCNSISNAHFCLIL